MFNAVMTSHSAGIPFNEMYTSLLFKNEEKRIISGNLAKKKDCTNAPL